MEKKIKVVKDAKDYKIDSLQDKISELKESVNNNIAAWVVFLVMLIVWGMLWIIFWITKFEVDKQPLIQTGTVYQFDTKNFKINSEVYKINTDMTTSKRVLKWIYAREWGIMYYIEDCLVKEREQCNWDWCRMVKTYWCDSWEEVKYIGNTEKEVFDIICNK